MPDSIKPVDTSAGWSQPGQKLLITGTMFKNDGVTPAPGVILYYYHTDINGVYANRPGLDQRVVRHGYIRGWVKSGPDGKYSIYTVRPSPYPNRTDPAHIHPAIKEPGNMNEYYIDEFVFDDDKLLTTQKRRAMENRGGSGILRIVRDGELQVAEHDIILGMNVPGYPATKKEGIISGLAPGNDQPSFTPFHAYGPDKGSHACPVCKYGRYYGILYFVGNKPDWPAIREWLSFLEKESTQRKKYLKAYFVYGNANDYDPANRMELLENLGKELLLQQVALTFVPSFSDKQSDAYLNGIDPESENTIIVYRHGSIIRNYTNLKPSETSYAMLKSALDVSSSPYFELAGQ